MSDVGARTRRTFLAGLSAGVPFALIFALAPARTDGASMLPELELAAEIIASPKTVSIGQLFEVTLTVANVGKMTGRDVAAGTLRWTGSGDAILIKGPDKPDRGMLSPGAKLGLSWTLRAKREGKLKFIASASAVDAATGIGVSLKPVRSAQLAVQSPPSFAAGLEADNYEPCLGEEICVILTVTNTGQAAALGIAPPRLVWGGEGATTVLSEAVPGVPIDLGGGECVSWMWTLAGRGPGPVGLTATICGKDANSGEGVLGESRGTLQLQVHRPGILTLALDTVPLASAGQWVPLTATVSNTGDAPIRELSMGIKVEEGAGTIVREPPPTPDFTLLPGQDRTFLWTYSTEAAGELRVSAAAEAVTCANVPLSSTGSANLKVERPAQLKADLSLSATVLVKGQKLTVALSVTDAGEARAQAVRPELMECTGPVARMSPYPGDFRELASGEGTVFLWTYSAAGTGETACSVRARGIDANSRMPIMTDWLITPPMAILEPADLTLRSLRLLPTGSVIQEAFVNGFLVIANDGEADAVVKKLTIAEHVPASYKQQHKNARPSLTRWFGPATAFPLTVAGGEVAVVMWAYRAVQPGPTYVSAAIEAEEPLTGRNLGTMKISSNEVSVEAPPKEEEE